MSDSPSKRARERRKAQKRRDKKTRVSDRPPEDGDHEAIAARYLALPDDDEASPQDRAR